MRFFRFKPNLSTAADLAHTQNQLRSLYHIPSSAIHLNAAGQLMIQNVPFDEFARLMRQNRIAEAYKLINMKAPSHLTNAATTTSNAAKKMDHSSSVTTTSTTATATTGNDIFSKRIRAHFRPLDKVKSAAEFDATVKKSSFLRGVIRRLLTKSVVASSLAGIGLYALIKQHQEAMEGCIRHSKTDPQLWCRLTSHSCTAVDDQNRKDDSHPTVQSIFIRPCKESPTKLLNAAVNCGNTNGGNGDPNDRGPDDRGPNDPNGNHDPNNNQDRPCFDCPEIDNEAYTQVCRGKVSFGEAALHFTQLSGVEIGEMAWSITKLIPYLITGFCVFVVCVIGKYGYGLIQKINTFT